HTAAAGIYPLSLHDALPISAVDRVWNAFAVEEEKLRWWGAGDQADAGEWTFDFRIGGRDVAEAQFHDGPLSRYEATYTDIVEHRSEEHTSELQSRENLVCRL